jgi:hypothetical protein
MGWQDPIESANDSKMLHIEELDANEGVEDNDDSKRFIWMMDSNNSMDMSSFLRHLRKMTL